eukprot:3934331-Pyramimonas_sp.AAC.1
MCIRDSTHTTGAPRSSFGVQGLLEAGEPPPVEPAPPAQRSCPDLVSDDCSEEVRTHAGQGREMGSTSAHCGSSARRGQTRVPRRAGDRDGCT